MRRRWNDCACRAMTASRAAGDPARNKSSRIKRAYRHQREQAMSNERAPRRWVLFKSSRDVKKVKSGKSSPMPGAPPRDPPAAEASNGGEPLSFIYLIPGHLSRQTHFDLLDLLLISSALDPIFLCVCQFGLYPPLQGPSCGLPAIMGSSIINIQRDSRELWCFNFQTERQLT